MRVRRCVPGCRRPWHSDCELLARSCSPQGQCSNACTADDFCPTGEFCDFGSGTCFANGTPWCVDCSEGCSPSINPLCLETIVEGQETNFCAVIFATTLAPTARAASNARGRDLELLLAERPAPDQTCTTPRRGPGRGRHLPVLAGGRREQAELSVHRPHHGPTHRLPSCLHAHLGLLRFVVALGSRTHAGGISRFPLRLGDPAVPSRGRRSQPRPGRGSPRNPRLRRSAAPTSRSAGETCPSTALPSFPVTRSSAG